jgi:7-cyano-7-deazaguanine synthase
MQENRKIKGTRFLISCLPYSCSLATIFHCSFFIIHSVNGMVQHSSDTDSLALLVSGGLDSAILLAESIKQYVAVFPLYIRCGLFYEPVELAYLQRFLEAVGVPALRPLVILEMPVTDLYGKHWSLTGRDVPSQSAPDEAVFLPGRNVLLLAKAMLWCHLHGVNAVALGSLQTNPFPDATPEFFVRIEALVNQAVRGSVQIVLPYGGLSKVAVMHRGRGLPLEHTFSCIAPQNGLHCGACNKCGERRAAFAAAGMSDPTRYAATE